MRTFLSICALTIGLVGIYLVGTGVFMHGGFPPPSWDVLYRPFASTNPVPSLVLVLSVALAFFALAASAEPKPGERAQRSSVLMWGGLFCVLTAAGFVFLLFALWRQGSSSQDLGLIFCLAGVQACLGVVLGGGAVIANKERRRVTVPVFLAGVLEAAVVSAVVLHGFAV